MAPPAVHTVHLVGAGPGDPGLITVRGLALLREADVVIADRLVSPALLGDLPPHAEVIIRGEHLHQTGRASDQAELNALLVAKAREGKRVVRLKGGDPFVFGRGGEEALALREAGIPFAIVPGVTAAIAAPAYAGIPVTHRGIAGAVTFVTGHETEGKNEGHVDWPSLARGSPTIVLYMSVTRLEGVIARLIEAGRDPATPVAIIERGTMPEQRTIVGTLVGIVEAARAAGISPPALTIVGEVVRLGADLAWFDNKPLHGQRVLYATASVEENEAAATGWDDAFDEIEAATGLGVVRVRLQEHRTNLAVVRSLLDRRAEFTWIALTSRRAAFALNEGLRSTGLDVRALAGLRIAALDATANLLDSLFLGVRADVRCPDGGRALADAILAAPPPHGPVAHARSTHARPELADCLAERGVTVEPFDVYSSEPEPSELARAIAGQRDVPYSAVAFTSPRNAAILLDGGLRLDGTLVGAIGHTTASYLASRGVHVDLVASRPAHAALMSELAAALAARAPIR